MSAVVPRPRWVYVMIVVVGAALAFGIAGVPSTQHDPPVHVLTTTTLAPTGASGTG